MAMTQKQKDAYFAEAKKRGNISKGEIITPSSVVRGVAKVAAKVAGKQTAKKLTTAEKAMVKDVKSVAKNAKPGSVSKMLDKLPLEERRAYSQALRKAVPDKKKAAIYNKTKQAKPIKSVKRTTDPINRNAQTDAILEQLYAKSLKATKATGGDPKKIKVTYNGRTIDFNGIK
jgi:hypothetical protein